MDTLNSPNDSFDFNKMSLTTPISLNNGNHFIKYYLNDGPLYIQPPKCIVKQGIVKATKKLFFDLMFTNENDEFIRWLENLEVYSRKFIFNNREKWFETELDENDIENSFTSPLKTYKSGKFYILRVSIPTHLGKTNLKIYDEQENILSLENITENDNVITALEVLGIKCSPRSFQIEIELKQLLKLNQNNIFEKCILGRTGTSPLVKNIQQMESIIEESTNDDNGLSGNNSDDVAESVLTENVDDVENNVVSTETSNENQIVDPEDNSSNIVDASHNGENMNDESIPLEIDSNKMQDIYNDELEEVDFDLEHIPEEPNEEDINTPIEIDIPLEKIDNEPISLKNRNDIYYEMYRDALTKAKEAKDLALSKFMEAKQIKNKYMLEDIDSDLEDDSIELLEE